MTSPIDRKVPQGGKTYWGAEILPVRELLLDSDVRGYVRLSLCKVLSGIGLEAGRVSELVNYALQSSLSATDLVAYETKLYNYFYHQGVFNRLPQKLLKRASKMCVITRPHLQGERLLDLGCGSGAVGMGLNPFLDKVVLADVYRHPHIPSAANFSLLFDSVSLPFGDNSFDDLLLMAMLHHVPNPVVLLTEAHRLLRTNGRIHLVETVWGVGYEDKKRCELLDYSFLELSAQQQRLATMFLDYFGNHVLWSFTTEPEMLVPVPFNFTSPPLLERTFAMLNLQIVHKQSLGVDPYSGVFHMHYVLQK